MDAKKGIIGNLEREALENKKKIETTERENLEFKHNLSKQSEQARANTQSWKPKQENLEMQPKQAEPISQNITLGMHFRFKLILDFPN